MGGEEEEKDFKGEVHKKKDLWTLHIFFPKRRKNQKQGQLEE
jgi:hypothetical protein